MPKFRGDEFAILQSKIGACTLCPRLRDHCREIARVKRRAYLDHDYWGKPVPSFGDPQARVLILGLAPGAHGANRTGRMFTGDKSGEFLYRALYETGFASQPTSVSRNDGLTLSGAYIWARRCTRPSRRVTLPSAKQFSNRVWRPVEIASRVGVSGAGLDDVDFLAFLE